MNRILLWWRRRKRLHSDPSIAVGFTITTAFLGAFLGLLPDVLTVGPRDPVTGNWTMKAAVLAGFLLVSIAAGCWSVAAWRFRNRMARRHGTAYIIQESMESWHPESFRRFLIDVDRRCARTLQVPGPDAIGEPWRWPVNRRLDQWDRAVEELVHAVRVLWRVDDQGTPNSLFVVAPWATSCAVLGRLTAAERGELAFNIRQRPSYGPGSDRKAVDWEQETFRFRQEPDDRPVPVHPTSHRWQTAVNWKEPADAPSTNSPPARGAAEPVPCVILLMRSAADPFGPIPPAGQGPPHTLTITTCSALTGLAATSVEVLELDHFPARIPWARYDDIARSAVVWIQSTATEFPKDTVFLLGGRFPQEIGLGVGIFSATHAIDEWPDNIYPLVHDQQAGLTVPNLNLGRAALQHPRWTP